MTRKSKTTTNLTFEEHKAFGLMLAQTRDRLIKFICEDCSGMRVHDPLRREAEHVIDRLDLLCSALDSQVFRDHPQIKNQEGFDAYYPNAIQSSRSSFSWSKPGIRI
ncbi:MAG: hypothetical protein WBZ14_09700 [Terriglobales bacterium]